MFHGTWSHLDTEKQKRGGVLITVDAMFVLFVFWGRPICCSFLHGFVHVSKVGFVHPIFSLRDINATLGLLPSRKHVIWRGSVSVGVKCQNPRGNQSGRGPNFA